jgi:hypothetical protein
MEERRRFPRIKIAGTAIVLVGGRYVGAYLLQNLSAGGAYLVGDNNLEVGQRVQLLLQVRDELQSVEAEVARQDRLPSDQHSFAVAFRNLSADVETSLQDLASRTPDKEPAMAATVLLLGGPSPVLSALERAVSSLGYTVVGASTPLDAIALLSLNAQPISAVVVACDHGGAESLGFLRFLKDLYPKIRRIAFSCAVRSAPCATPGPSGVIEAVLSESWDSRSLLEALRPAG